MSQLPTASSDASPTSPTSPSSYIIASPLKWTTAGPRLCLSCQPHHQMHHHHHHHHHQICQTASAATWHFKHNKMHFKAVILQRCIFLQKLTIPPLPLKYTKIFVISNVYKNTQHSNPTLEAQYNAFIEILPHFSPSSKLRLLLIIIFISCKLSI